MASVIRKLRKEAICSSCLRLMTDPMIIGCGHSFCRGCIIDIIESQQGEISKYGTYFCAVCEEAFQRESIRPNKKLQSIIKTIKKTSCEKLCEEHGEKLHLYCTDDDQLICLCCERKPQHKGHVLVLAEDVCQDYKEKLQEVLTKLREDEVQCYNLTEDIRKQIKEWKRKVMLERQKIQSEFDKLYNFLCKKETRYLNRLEEEEEQILWKLQECEDMLETQSEDLQNYILELEGKCQDSVQNFMENVKATLRRSSEVKLELPEAISLDLHTASDVSQLCLDVRKVLKKYKVSMTLDPETAPNDQLLFEPKLAPNDQLPCEDGKEKGDLCPSSEEATLLQ